MDVIDPVHFPASYFVFQSKDWNTKYAKYTKNPDVEWRISIVLDAESVLTGDVGEGDDGRDWPCPFPCLLSCISCISCSNPVFTG
jgi:hypothetical protein